MTRVNQPVVIRPVLPVFKGSGSDSGKAREKTSDDKKHLSLTRSVRSENGMGQHYTDPSHPFVRRAVTLAQQTGARDVLELGAGRGLGTLAVAQEANPARIVATDINEIGLRQLKNTAEEKNLPVETKRFNVADKLPKDWQKNFDLVLAKDVYPFLNPRETTRFLKNAALALRPDGYFLFSAPQLDSKLAQSSQQTMPTNPYYRKLTRSTQKFIQTTQKYFNFVTERQLKRKLWQAGLEMRETEAFGRENGWVMVLAQKRPPNQAPLANDRFEKSLLKPESKAIN